MSRNKSMKVIVKRVARSNHYSKNQAHDDCQNYPASEISSHCPCKYHQRSFHIKSSIGLTKKAEPPPTCDVNRDSGTDSANGGWLRRLVRHTVESHDKYFLPR